MKRTDNNSSQCQMRNTTLIFMGILSFGFIGCIENAEQTINDELRVDTSGSPIIENSIGVQEELPYLKLLFAHDGALYQKEGDDAGKQIYSEPDTSSVVDGESPIYSTIPGKDNAGVDATFFNNFDWVAWANGDELLARRIGYPSSNTTTIHHSDDNSIESPPEILPYDGKLLAAWLEGGAMRMATLESGKSNWSDPFDLIPSSAGYIFGERLSLFKFKNKLYVAYVLNNRLVRLTIIKPDFTWGASFNVYRSPDPIIEGSVSVATNGDEMMSLVFSTSGSSGGNLVAMHGTNPRTWQGPYYMLENFNISVAPSAAYANSLNHKNFYAAIPTATLTPTYYVLKKDTDDLYSDGAVNLEVNTNLSLQQGFFATLYNSPYSRMKEELFISAKELVYALGSENNHCGRDIGLRAIWPGELPGSQVDRFEVLVNGEKITDSDADDTQEEMTIDSGHMYWVPQNEVTITARAVLSNGDTVDSSNSVNYTFVPCTNDRLINLGIIRTKIEGSEHDVQMSEPELDEAFFGSDPESLASHFNEMTGGKITFTGQVLTVASLPGEVEDYCSKISGGWGWECGSAGKLKVTNVISEELIPDLKANYDFDGYIFLIGGIGAPGDGWASRAYLSGKWDITEKDEMLETTVHELGHCFGLDHSGLWTCSGIDKAQPLVGPVWEPKTEGCELWQYAEGVEPMAAGRGYYAAFYGTVLGYIDTTQSEPVTQSGEYILHAVETATDGGLVELRVQFPGQSEQTFYSVEYRKPLGWDNYPLEYQNFKNLPAGEPVEGLVAYLHSSRMRAQSDNVELAMLEHLAVPGSPIVDMKRNITINLVEELGDDRALVHVTYGEPAPDFLSFGVAGNWSSETADLQPVVEDDRPALKIDAEGYILVESRQFTTWDLTGISDSIAVDIKLPVNMPNPYWYGDIQAFFSCPSAGFFNNWLGYVSLTGLPTDVFQTITFDLPPSVQDAFMEDHSDLNLAFALNLDSGETESYYLAGLRFAD